MGLVRYGLPATLALAGAVVLAFGGGASRTREAAMLVDAGVAMLMHNTLYRLGAPGDLERRDGDRGA